MKLKFDQTRGKIQVSIISSLCIGQWTNIFINNLCEVYKGKTADAMF